MWGYYEWKLSVHPLFAQASTILNADLWTEHNVAEVDVDPQIGIFIPQSMVTSLEHLIFNRVWILLLTAAKTFNNVFFNDRKYRKTIN